MPYFATIRYGKMLQKAKCKTDIADLKEKEKCVVKTDRGVELGTLLTPIEPIPENFALEGVGEITRRATSDDISLAQKLEKEDRVKAMNFCKENIKKINVQMKLVDVDYLLGGERIVFYFISETRVDFRELVKVLAQEFKTRIELKQIGARDEAKLVGDCGHCGLKLCCNTFLEELGGVSIEMAKLQKHTADPTKITGRCGKLLCCLRYEYSFYDEARNILPPVGTIIETKKGKGTVVSQNLLFSEVTIQNEGKDRIIVGMSDIPGLEGNRVAGCNGCSKGEAKN